MKGVFKFIINRVFKTWKRLNWGENPNSLNISFNLTELLCLKRQI